MATTNKLPGGSTWNKFTVENVVEDTTVQVTFAEDANGNDIPDKYEKITVYGQAGEHGSVTPEKKIITPGESVVFTITPEEGYVVDSIQIGDTIYVNNPNFGKAYVEDASGITDALEDPEVNELVVNSPMTVSTEVQVSKPMTINGNGNMITKSEQGKAFTMTANSTFEDVVVEITADNKEWHSSYGVQFYTGEHTVKDSKFSGGNAAIIVNGATVNLEGTIDVSGNTFGGIEVCKGSNPELTAGVLNIGTASIVNTTEEYGKPTIWIDGNTDTEGVVNGASAFTMVEVPHGDTTQKHYYLNSFNSKPILVGDKSYDTLAAAIKEAKGDTIHLKADVDGSVSIDAGSNVVIDGEGHTMHGMLDLKSGSAGLKGSVKVSNIIFDGNSDTDWALRCQNQTATAGQSSFDVEFENCEFKNMTKKAIYVTETTKLKVVNCTFDNCAIDEMNDPNTYGDYVIDCNLVGVKDVEVEITGCTFKNNHAQKSAIKVTQRGGESDEGATDMPKGVTASVASFTVTGCTFNDTKSRAADVAIGSENKSAETNPEAVNTTGDFGQTTISGNTTPVSVITQYDNETYEVAVGKGFTRVGSGDPIVA